MKLRMRKNSLRLRLSRSEIADFQGIGFVEESVAFANGTLIYRIERSFSATQVTADLECNRISVVVPNETAAQWTSTQQVGFAARCSDLEILVEKDFQCEHGAPDHDAFARSEVS